MNPICVSLSLSLSLSLWFRLLLCPLVMHTVAAPSRHISPVRSARPSPLNPTRPRAAAAPVLTKPPPSSKTHLANLDRLLQKPSPAPTPSLPPLPEGAHGAAWAADLDGGRRWDTLNALNLSGVLPAARKVEEMSPRSLNQLQRLLIGTPRPSPRGGIAGRWRDLHGARDWEGLLDPLDEDLRREIVRNGDFVQAAYHAFHSNPGKKPSDRRQVALPDRSYRVTRDLYATSSIEIPRLVDGVAPWMRQRTSWVGYVAVCDSEREIQRMGRRDVVIALRGTATALEWAENFRAALVKVPHADDDAGVPTAPDQATVEGGDPPSEEEQVEPKVECGFWSLFTTESKQERSLRDTVVEEVRRLMEVYKGEQLSITVTGHSLGAALAVLVADELGASLGPGAGDSPPIAVFSFGSPHVGNRGFAGRVRDRGVKVLRVVNKRDVITRMPGVFADYQKVVEEADREAGGGEARRRWLRAAAEGGKQLVRLPDRWRDAVERAMTAWSYTHVGSELRLDSRQSPFLKPDAGPGCCHDLEAYLHLVDGFLSSRCPFRANAKRSIVKLMAHEGSSVKRHYTSRALALIGMEVAAAADAEAVLAADGGGRGCVPSPTSS